MNIKKKNSCVRLSETAAFVADQIIHMEEVPVRIAVGEERTVRAYYTPLGTDGKLKARPVTKESCTGCRLCAKVCPMGSIFVDDPAQVTGICIKCQACVKMCPVHAKYFDDPAFLSHVAMLEQNYERKAENRIFI